MQSDDGTNRRWAELCEQHDAATREVDAAFSGADRTAINRVAKVGPRGLYSRSRLMRLSKPTVCSSPF
jgi:hypothetical protein